MMKYGKRLKKAYETVDANKVYALDEAIAAVKAGATAKFDETIDIAVRLGVDPRQSDQMVRGAVSLPAGTGKTLRVAVFAKGPKAEEARKAGADIVGDEDLMNAIMGGKIDFERLIATPDMMGVVGRLGKVLGPKGLMPNPKLGTVTMDVANAVKAAKAGQVQFRVDAVGIVHAGIGKASFSQENIAENVKAFVKNLLSIKPASASGVYLKQVALSSTQGVGVKVSIPTIIG
ncbi:MAG: 50S ribosomal protein L1 [Alphaproteobacteria bacterium]|nr:50S ribosomal protein L1 [Alphaproteobacteria bacterium]